MAQIPVQYRMRVRQRSSPYLYKYLFNSITYTRTPQLPNNSIQPFAYIKLRVGKAVATQLCNYVIVHDGFA